MNSDVGARMLVLRKLNGWSQRQLAKRAGVPHSAISMIEHGQVSPSINSLQKVLDGVPISMAEFFALDLNIQLRVFFKKEDTETELETGITRSQIQTKLRNGIPAAQTFREIYPAGGDSGEESLTGDGELIGYVVSGFVEVSVGGEVDVLKSGDGFYFERRRPHKFKNVGDTPAEVVATLLPTTPKK